MTVSGSVTGLTVDAATLTIVDDRRGLFASRSRVEVPEGETAMYTLVLESEPTATVTVTASRTGDEDITVTGGATLTFTANDWYLPQAVTVSAAADADSLDGTATITHTAAGGDYDGVTTSVAAVEQDKMGASTKVTVSLSPDEVGEGDGQTTVTVTGRLDGEALESPTTVTVSVGASGDGATAGTDYGTVAGFTFQILAGATEGSGTFNITPADDDIDEGNESVTVSGSVTGLSVDGATLTIVDDDTRGLLASRSRVEVPEGETATYTLVLESEPTATVTVTASRTGDEDITVTGGATLTFTANDWYLPQAVTLSAAYDADDVDGTATITHTTSGGDYGANNVSASVTAVEQDKMGASTKVTLSLSPDEVGEGDGQTTVTVTGRLDGEALESPTTVTVSVGANGDGATAGTDYGTVAGFTFQILAGATEGSGTFNITPADDDFAEGNESVTVSGSVTGLSVDGATLTIVDDDRRGLFPSPRTVTVPEGETATYTLVLESKPTATVTVTAARTGDEDITVTGGDTLTFTADDWYVPQTVTLSAARDEDDENGTATITHTASGGDYDGVTATVTATEKDDEGAWTLEFRSDGSAVNSVAEDAGSVEIVVSRGQAPSEPMVVTLSGEGSAESGSDWELESTTLTLAAGSTETTVQMTILDDARLEDSETVTVRAQVNGGEVASGALEILDDDRATIALVTETPTVEEGSSVTVSVVVEPTGAGCVIPFDIMPSIAVEDSGGAVSSTVPTTVMIPACEAKATFSFDTEDDDEATGDRLVVLTVAVSEDDRILGGTLTVRVTDNDNSPAEGAPTITGIPQVDETLTAHTDAVSDADGLTEVAWRYQWLRVSGATEPEISGATERTYVVQEADVGSRLKVRVDFEDDAGNAESLASAPTDEVRAKPATPVVTVAALEATVTEGEAARFAVRVAPAAESALTVIVGVTGTNDVLAGTPGPTVTIEAGQDSAILMVATEDDDVDEGIVAGMVTAEVLVGAGYELGTPASATVTVQDDDEVVPLDLSGWLARVGRTTSDQVVETVRGRMTRGPGGTRMVIGGWDLQGLGAHYSIKPSDRLAMWSRGERPLGRWPNGETTLRDLFGRSSFSASGQLDGGDGYWSVWGRGATTRFSGGVGDASVDGELNGFMGGFDLARGRWLGGVVVSHNRADGTLGEAGPRGREVGTILTGVYPWARYSITDQLSAWAMLGYAGGSLSLDGGSDSDPNANLAMAALGWRGDVIGTSGEQGFSLALTSDAVMSRTTTGDETIGDHEGTASRVRLLVEGSHGF
ncbi:Calx-beta domain-containing protein [Candidatus Palauibacter sp.]|uniref:Calx-beta domain-containing protein n=1 Tax=Candidatus Palauibacter sp. TaxID=3101350 RepID=UPI003CC506AE